MRLMQAKADPEAALRAAAQQSRLAPQAVESIVSCAKGKSEREAAARRRAGNRGILTSTRFVPFIALNGRSHLHMQAVQMMLPSKLKAWKQILSAPNGNAPNSSCNSMPDFWCSSPEITQECFNEAGCRNHQNAVWGRPINLKLVFRSDNHQARSYVMNYVKRYFLSSENSRIKGKATFELEARGLAPESVRTVQLRGPSGPALVSDASIRTKMIVCLLEAGGSALESWNSRCHTFLPAVRDSVSECAKSNEWRGELAKRAAAHNAYWPVIPQKDPWLLVNGYSLPTAQFYLEDLHRLVCMWYRGPGHSRDDCSRCEYEQTHCLRG
ncbi:Gamma-interferon-inducible lysosomal thiol reductase [Aphelenchoides fujianensis]|nr:Gamma-interferon-inducible lysosomal thiol reductase [Aphelenchoides fujianensis]